MRWFNTRTSVAFVIAFAVCFITAGSSGPVAHAANDPTAPPITLYVTPAITDDQILPTTFIPDEYISDRITLAASPGEYEPASLVLRARDGISALTIKATSLVSGNASIPASNVDIRVVKCWYQSGKTVRNEGLNILTPELLLKDDSLVRVQDGHNYVKLSGEYIWISSPDGVPGMSGLPTIDQFPVQDSLDLQPVDIPVNTNKQFWITVHVPEGTPPGIYAGEIGLKTAAGLVGQLQINLEVLPIRLLSPYLLYGLYYFGSTQSHPSGVMGSITSRFRTQAQYRAELKDLLDHGVNNPSAQYWDIAMLARDLEMRNEMGLSGRPLYLDFVPMKDMDKSQVASVVSEVVSIARANGFTDVYFYGKDEAKGDELAAQREVWEVIHYAGGKIWASGYAAKDHPPGNFTLMGDIQDAFNCAGQPDPLEAQKWHVVAGHQILCYGNPQGGEERSETYRRNYGLLLWQTGYDGTMNFAYQHSVHNYHVWNDFQHGSQRPHNFTYPTANGVIDTIQWEGWREGVDDVRYLTTLLDTIGRAQGIRDTAPAEAWLAQLKVSDLRTEDLSIVRSQMIGYILDLQLSAMQGDSTPPVMSSVAHSVLTLPLATTTITWHTDEQSTSCVDYGETPNLGDTIELTNGLSTDHAVTLSGLNINTIYHYRVKSRDTSGNLAVSKTFTIDTTPSLQISDVSMIESAENGNIRISIDMERNTEASWLVDWNRSLVGYWGLDESRGGTTTTDRSSYGNTGTLINGPQWTSGRFGSALNFDGVDDYVNCGKAVSLDMSDAVTYSMWLLPTEPRSLCHGKAGAYQFIQYDTEELQFFVVSGGDNVNYLSGTAHLPTGEWTHVTGVYDGTRVSLYVNGKLASESRPTSGKVDTSTIPFRIGSGSGWKHGYFKGTVDEVRVWNRALTPAEIWASYDADPLSSSFEFADLPTGTYQYRVWATNILGVPTQTEDKMVTVKGGATVQFAVNRTTPSDSSSAVALENASASQSEGTTANTITWSPYQRVTAEDGTKGLMLAASAHSSTPQITQHIDDSLFDTGQPDPVSSIAFLSGTGREICFACIAIGSICLLVLLSRHRRLTRQRRSVHENRR